MKPKRSNPLLSVLRRFSTTTAIVISFIGCAQGIPLYWDTNGTGTGSGNATTGAWDAATTNWSTDSTGASAGVVWQNGSDTIFSAGTDGVAAKTVTISGTVSTPLIKLEEVSLVTLSGGTINITGGTTFDTSVLAATGGRSLTWNPTITGTGNLTLKVNGSTAAGGDSSDTIFALTGTNTFVGDVRITSGVVGYTSNFGNSANKLVLDGGGLVFNNTGTLARNIEAGAAGGVLRAYGAATATHTGILSGTGTLRRTDGGTFIVTQTASHTGNWGVERGSLQVGNATQTTDLIGSSNIITLGDASNATTLRYRLNGDLTWARPAAKLVLANAASTLAWQANTVSQKLVFNNATALTDTTKGVLRLENGIVNLASGADVKVNTVQFTNATATNASMLIESGSSLTTKYLNIGEGGSTGGVITQTGGQVTVETGSNGVRIGHWGSSGSSASQYNISGGTLDSSAIALNVGWDGAGTLSVSGTGLVKAKRLYVDAAGADNPGIVNLNGGTIEVGSDGMSNDGTTGSVFNWGGGTAKAVATSIWQTPMQANAATTSTLDLNSFNVTLNRNVTGTGTINLISTLGGGQLILDPSTGSQSVAAALSGSQAITKVSAGTTTLSGTSTHNGTLSISAGRLNLALGGGSASNVTVASSAVIGGEGTLTGTLVTPSGSIIAVDPATPAALTVGNLDLSTQPTVVFDSVPTLAQSPITILNYTGTLTGVGSDVVISGVANYRTPVVTAAGGVVSVTLGSAATTWNGTLGGQWDVMSSARWGAGGTGLFAWGDAVTFDDTGVNPGITMTGELRPSSIVVSSSTNNYSFSGTGFISGSTGLLKSGTSTLTMSGANTFTGGTVISQGTINIQSAGALGTGTVTLGDGSTGSNNVALYLDTTSRVNFARQVIVSSNGTGTATLGSRTTAGPTGGDNHQFTSIVLQRDVILDSNAFDRTDYENISGTGNIQITGTGRTVFISTSTFTGNVTVAPTAGGYLQTGTATAGNQNYIPDTSNLIVNNTNNGSVAEYRLSSGGETVAGLSGNGNIDVNSIAGTLTVGSGGANGSFSGTLANGGASVFSLTKTGAGKQVLSGPNSYTGVTTISGGILQFGTTASLYNNNQASWIAANLIVASGATAAFNVGGLGEFTAGNIDTIRVLSNVASGVTATAGFKSGSYLGLDTTNAGGSFTYSSVIANHVAGATTDTLGIRKLGSGTLVLSGASTYTGVTAVDAGILEITNKASGTGRMHSVAQGATLQLGYSTSTGNGFGYNCGVTVNGTSVGDGTGLYLKGGLTQSFGGTLTLQTAPSTVRAYDTGSATLTGGDVNNTYVSVPTSGSGSVIDSSVNISCSGYGYRMSTTTGANTATGDLVINSVISGSGSNGNGGPYATSLRKEGTGSVLLTAANTYGNGIYVGGGSIIVGGGDDRLPVGAGVILNSGTFLRLNGISQTVSNVSNAGSGGAVVGNSATLSTLNISSSANATLSTLVGGTGTNENNIALGKSGSGILTLANSNNTYEGGTTVNAGTLRINDSSGTVAGTGAVTVNLNGTLDGYGTLNSDVTVSAAGGTVAGGTGVDSLLGDTLTVGSLTFEGEGAIAVIPNFTMIAVSNSLTASGTAGSVAVNIGTTPLSVGTYDLVTHSGAIGGTGVSAFTVGTNPGGPFNYSISDSGGVLRLTVTTSALFWNGNNGNGWSVANNWKTGTGVPVSFSNGVAVVFNDAATSLTVDLSSANVTPTSVTFANSFGYDYTLGGTKSIGGTGGLLKSGTGTVTIDTSNSFTGDVTINQGVLNAASIANAAANSSLGAGTGIVLGGGTLGYTGLAAAVTDRSVTVNTTSTIQLNAGNLTISGLVEGTAGLVKTGTGTLVLDNTANFLAGTLTVNGGTVQVDEAAKLGANSVALAGGTLAFTGTTAISTFQTISLGAGGGTIQADNTAGTALTAAVTGTGGFTKTGAGTLTFSTNKNFSGGVTVNNGTLYIGAGGWYTNPFGSVNTVTINTGGKVQTAGAHSLGTDSNPVVINGGTLQLGAEQYATTLVMTGGLVTGGELRNWGGTMTFNASSTGAVIASSFSLVGNANLNVADGAAVADLTISGSVTNAGTLTKSGDGKLVLQGLSTYTSNTTVNAGTLELKDDARLTFVIPASGASNKISGAGTAEFNGDFLINTTAAAALATGTWTLEDVTGTATYGTSFQVVNSDGSPWTSSGGTWTKVSGSQLWTYDKTSGVLTLAVAGYEAWASQIGDSNQRDREDDPDTDGFTNIQEFLFGTNPTTNTGSLTSMTSDGSFLTIRWSERTSGAGYQLLESATLANPWVLSGTTPSNDGPAVGDYQPRKAEVTIVAGKNFFRVEGVEN